eukprot:754565-Hanusia_phi.AAC.1
MTSLSSRQSLLLSAVESPAPYTMPAAALETMLLACVLCCEPTRTSKRRRERQEQEEKRERFQGERRVGG